MTTQWYCKIGDRQVGPLPTEELQEMAVVGQLSPSNLVRRGEKGQWMRAVDAEELDFPNAKKLRLARPLRDKPTPPPTPPPVRQAGPQSSAPSQPRQPAATPVYSQEPTPVYQRAEAAPRVDNHRGQTTDAGLNAAIKWIIGLGVCIVIGLFVVILLNLGGEEPKTSQTAASGGTDAKLENSKAGTKPDKDQPKSESEQPTSSDAALSTISNWRDMSKGARLVNRKKQKDVVVWVVDVWLGSAAVEAAGEPVAKDKQDEVFDPEALGLDPNKQRTTVTGRIIETPKPKRNSPTGKGPQYVFVEMRVENKSDSSLMYASLNGVAKSNADSHALLFDDAGNLCQLVGVDEVDLPDRLAKAEIAAGEAVTDLLVFEPPPEDFEELQLLLPRAAIGMESSDQVYLGYRISKSELTGDRASGDKDVPVLSDDEEADSDEQESSDMKIPSERPADSEKVRTGTEGTEAFEELKKMLEEDE